MKLVYIYDCVSLEQPPPKLLTPTNLLIGPHVVNNLGWIRGYWEIMESRSVNLDDVRERHLFASYHGTGSRADYDLVNENGDVVVDPRVDPASLGPAGFSNFNYIDKLVTHILKARGVIRD